MPNRPLQVRDVILFKDEVGKRRPAVIVRLEAGQALVSAGSTKGPREIIHLRIDPQQRLTRNMNLDEPTFFYVTKVYQIATDDVVLIGTCPPGMFVEFRGLVDRALREYRRQILDMVGTQDEAGLPGSEDSPKDKQPVTTKGPAV